MQIEQRSSRGGGGGGGGGSGGCRSDDGSDGGRCDLRDEFIDSSGHGSAAGWSRFVDDATHDIVGVS